MSTIQIAIAGPDAVPATEDLLAMDGISGSYTLDSETEKDGVLATIATIIGVVGGTMAIAEQIRKWYQDYRQNKNSKVIEKAMIIHNGKKLLLENATTEQIKALLDS